VKVQVTGTGQLDLHLRPGAADLGLWPPAALVSNSHFGIDPGDLASPVNEVFWEKRAFPKKPLAPAG
jgi:hypothetical protein